MRKLLIILAVVFTASIFATIAVEAATATQRYKTRHTISSKQRSMKGKYSHKKMTSMRGKHYTSKKSSMRARMARGPAMKCTPVKKHLRHRVLRHRVVRKAAAARVARGPVVSCPAPVVNVPQQPAPVVNVPQQPAPVVNVPPFPATVGVSTDATQIYIVRENQLMVLDKCTYEVKKVVQLQPSQ